jgi:hypothetical protein
MYFTKTCPLSWLIPFFAWIVATNALSQNDPSAAPESNATPNKKAEAQKTLTYSNAVIGYCNRLNSFALSTQLLLRDGQKVLAGDILATKYMLPPLFDEKSLDIREGDGQENPELIPSTVSEEDRNYFLAQIQSLKEMHAKLKTIDLSLVTCVVTKQYAEDAGAKGKQLLADGLSSLKELANQSSATGKRAEALGQASEQITIEDDPRRTKIYALREDLENAKEFTSFLNGKRSWSAADAGKVEELLNKVRSSVSKHSGMQVDDYEKNRGDFYSVFYKSANNFIDLGSKALEQLKTQGAPRPVMVGLVSSAYQSMVGEYNLALSP